MNSETLTRPLNVLLIEDNAGDARLIQEELKDAGDVSMELTRVSQLQEGLDYLSQHEVDIVLSDLSLPDSPGMDTYKRLQAQINVPIVVLTGFDNEATALDAVREGAQDYLIKGQVDSRTLVRTILYAIERHRSQSTLRSLSLTDELTRLYNRRGFMTLADQSLKSAIRAKSRLVLMYADMDNLKQINDTLGHPDGDHAITAAAQILRQTFRQADIVARIGGDEFAVLAAEDQSGGHDILLSRLNGNIAQFNLQNPNAYAISLSVGVAHFDPHHPSTVAELLAAADKNLYVDKKQKSVILPEKERKKLLLLLLLLLLLGMSVSYLWSWWRSLARSSAAVVPAAVATPVVVKKASTRTVTSAPVPAQGWRLPTPPPLQLRRELIPKDIVIERFRYSRALLEPGDTVEFNIVGSGFTAAFHQTLSVYSGSPHVQVRNLRLVTVNQIRGEFVIHPLAPTQYVFPHILLQDTPVFQAANPYAVIRKGEVLNIVFTRMDADGKGGRFRAYTNLSPEQTEQFAIRSEVTGLDVSPLSFRPPYLAEGSLRIASQVPRGDYDLVASLSGQDIFRKDHLVQVIRATLGRTGFIQNIVPQTKNARPGDTVRVMIQGRGFEAADVTDLVVRMSGVADTPVRFESPARLVADLTLPEDAPLGQYDIGITQKGGTLFASRGALSVVGANWVERLIVNGSLQAGQKTTLILHGRDFTQEFNDSLRLFSDDAGIQILRPIRLDYSSLQCEIRIGPNVVAGDYLIQILSGQTPVKPAEGAIITVQPG